MSEDTKEELLWIIECRNNPAWGAATIVRYAARIAELEAENQRLRDALMVISDWKLPRVKDRHGMETSYGFEYGSNGERDYMRNVAQAALLGVEKNE